jgi:hypothetical protein
VNSRLLSLSGQIRMMVDPSKAPHVVKDFEGTSLLEGGSGQIDKKKDSLLSHSSDAIGYRTWRRHPIKKRYVPSGQKYHK